MRHYEFIFFAKIQEYDVTKDRFGCPGGSMLQRLDTAVYLIVRGLSISVVLRVVLNFYHYLEY